MTCSNGLSSWKCVHPIVTCCDLSGWALVEYVLFCNALWWISYYFLLVATRQSEEWCCRFLTFFHGCLVSYTALRDAYVNKSPIDFKSTPLSEIKKHYLSYMLSYFLFDFCWIHFFGNEAWIIYVHHLASILIIINVMMKNYGGAGVAYAVAGLEFTNPYLQLRWFLRTHGYLNRPIHKITELWFMALFFTIRMLGGTVLVYYAVIQSDSDFGLKLSFLSIYGISVVLQWQILVYFKKKYLATGHRSHVYLMQSRVSISPYFQRRTLDPPSDDEQNSSREFFSQNSPKTVEFAELESNKFGSPSVAGSPKPESPGGGSLLTASLKSESPGGRPSPTASPRVESPGGGPSPTASPRIESSGGGSSQTASPKIKSPEIASPVPPSPKSETPGGGSSVSPSIKAESPGFVSPKSERSGNISDKKRSVEDNASVGSESQKKQQNEE